MANSSSWPSIYCKTFHKNLDTCAEERTVRDCAVLFERFMTELGGNEKLGKLNFGQIRLPLFYPTLEEHKLCKNKISDFIVPSCLHDWMGVGNDFVHEIGGMWPDIVAEWVKHANVSAVGYWGGHFLGNQLRDLFEDVGFLEGFLGTEPLLQPYIVAIKAFDAVREACMGMVLDENYAEIINKFKMYYLQLGEDFKFPFTVKGHDVIYHYIEWLDKWKVPLGLVSEQTGECFHKAFNKFIDNKQCASPNSRHFPENLFKVVVAWASQAAVCFE